MALHDIGKDAEIGRAAWDVEMARHRHRLAGIGDLCSKEIRKARLDAVGDAMQRRSAFGGRQLAPRPLQRAPGRRYRVIDIGLGGLFDQRMHSASRRVDIVHEIADAARKIRAVDEVRDTGMDH